jgi:hypothetical protein
VVKSRYVVGRTGQKAAERDCWGLTRLRQTNGPRGTGETFESYAHSPSQPSLRHNQ